MFLYILFLVHLRPENSAIRGRVVYVKCKICEEQTTEMSSIYNNSYHPHGTILVLFIFLIVNETWSDQRTDLHLRRLNQAPPPLGRSYALLLFQLLSIFQWLLNFWGWI